ncbi:MULTISPECIES: FAD-linked oxidase C-terminal domain-containing protein [unclassified Modicisalibacter]|uniref:FAD-binding oxidoreductase n=1 Tax=unclassified Modicisalibacter TaxID=2679913 RepID=UPI001CCFAD72|nr:MULTISPECIES: FAD-linked oxidase C-terminal domain-containing protein [unclassified Modicisalibacter]MBZ9559243.1 FAD-binding protein [Modicisalibacter sp. R2A 31.J]MBZ9576592.1 FAD-binding protein [Modicisalibacter sp. MOD 31.J]
MTHATVSPSPSLPPRPSKAALEALIDELAPRLGERITTARGVRDQHGHDESWHHPGAPDAVCFPHSTEEVAAVVTACARHRVPVIPYGVGTSIEGQVIAEHGGLCIDLSAMNAILAVRPEDMDATVQPGVTRTQLNTHLRASGLFFSVDPGADASMGGMASTRASGTNTVRYGTIRENVLAMTVVMPDGRIVKTGSRARKSAAGYDLTHLMIGAEGTLGIITELTVRLHGLPEAVSSATVAFENVTGAVDTVIASIQYGIPMARIELMDALAMRAVNRFSHLDYAEKPTLFLEFHGTHAGVKEQAENMAALCQEFGGSDFVWATKEEERSALWQARHDAAYAAKALRPGAEFLATDICVPISELAACIEATQADVAASGLIAPLLGHVGDGNFHLVVAVDRESPEELETLAAFNRRLIERALAAGGTCTGEHGIGSGKRAYMEAEHGEGWAVMRSLKAALDPLGIMNPGKLV